MKRASASSVASAAARDRCTSEAARSPDEYGPCVSGCAAPPPLLPRSDPARSMNVRLLLLLPEPRRQAIVSVKTVWPREDLSFIAVAATRLRAAPAWRRRMTSRTECAAWREHAAGEATAAGSSADEAAATEPPPARLDGATTDAERCTPDPARLASAEPPCNGAAHRLEEGLLLLLPGGGCARAAAEAAGPSAFESGRRSNHVSQYSSQ